MESDTVDNAYPYVRREMVGSFGEVQLSVVDTKTGEVLATWVEMLEGGEWGEDINSNYQNNDQDKHELKRKFDPYSVYIGMLDPGITTEELIRYFGCFGEICRVTQLRDKVTGLPKGSAYMQFCEQGAAEGALVMDGSCLRGKLMTVRRKLINDLEKVHGHSRAQDLKDKSVIDPCSVYVCNLDPSVTRLDLAAHFHQVGKISKVTFLKKTGHRRGKGAAYIKFKDQVGMEKALSLNGSFLVGKNIKVERKRMGSSKLDLDCTTGENETVLSEEEEASSNHDPYSVFVGNVDLQTRKEELVKIFQTTGEIVRVTILKSKTAAYIQFKDHWSVEGALCMDGSKLRGGELKVRRKRMRGKM